MILVLFGQPGSGKTTIAHELRGLFMSIDGDRFYKIFKNNSAEREDEVALLNKASDIAIFLDSIGLDCVISMPYQYKEARDYLNSSKSDVYWVYLTYDSMLTSRGKELFHVEQFDEPEDDEDFWEIDTSNTSVDECIYQIEKYLNTWLM